LSRIPPHIVDEILSTARIEEVIGQFVNLKRAGSNLKGLSPFTDEKTPSFVVSPAKQIFKCFSTGKGGNVASFLMEKEHYSYPEALKWLAEKYNIELPEEKPLSAEEIESISERESLYIINEFAKNHFKHSLHETEEGVNIALSYFLERGLRKDIIEKFELGYCLNSGDDLTKNALAKNYRLTYLETVGLTKTKDNRSFDFFRGRVMFPIHSVTGRVLGFGGRTLFTDKKIAKYFNSPESIIYNKSEILYGLFFAKSDIVKYDNCYLVEGYADVISMHQSGIQNVVSSSGTSLTVEQIRLIKRYTNNITILYDGDAAGIKASFRGIDLILEEGLSVQVVLFPDGDDPDSYARKVSSEELEQYIKTAKQDFISFKAGILLDGHENDPVQKVKLIHDMVHSISLIPDVVTRTIYSTQIAQLFNVENQIITQEVNKLIVKNVSKEKGAEEQETTQLLDAYTNQQTTPFEQSQLFSPNAHQELTVDFVEQNLIRVLIKYGVNAIELETSTGIKEVSVAELIHHEVMRDELFFIHPLYTTIFQIVSNGLKANELYDVHYFLKSQNVEIVQLITNFESTQHELSENWTTKFRIDINTELDKLNKTIFESIYAFKLVKISEKINQIRTELATENLTDERIEELIMSQIIYEKVKLTIAKKLGRVMNNT
jgi:DNA primase